MNTFYIQFKTNLSDDKMKFLLVSVLFIFLNVTSIISTFYMEEILNLLGFGDFPTIVTPSATVAFMDFLGDQIFFGILIISLGSMSVFAAEIDSGAINFSLTRPISRRTYTLSKTIARTLALTLPFLLASLVGWSYVNFLFETFPLEIFLEALFPLLILYLYMGFLTSFFSTRYSTTNAGLVSIAILIFQMTLSVFEPLEVLSPFALAGVWTDILHSPILLISSDILIRFGLLVGWMIIPLFLTLYSLEKRDL